MGGRSAAAAARAAAWARLFPVALLGAVAFIVRDEEGASPDELDRVDQSEVFKPCEKPRPVDNEAENEARKPWSNLTFTFKNLDKNNNFPYFTWIAKKYFDEIYHDLRKHPNCLDEEDQVDLVFTGVGNKDHLEELLALPERNQATPYVVMQMGIYVGDNCSNDFGEAPKQFVTCIDNSTITNLRKRPDIVWLNYDMRDPNLVDDNWEPLPGVTMAPPNYFSGSKPNQSKLDSYEYLLSFRGSFMSVYPGGGRWVRKTLNDSFANFKYPNYPKVFVEFFPAPAHYTKKDTDFYNYLLENSAFALVPHGDLRWNLRFSEVVGACSIPVILADGITLPYTELINWTGAVLQLDESAVKNATQIIDSVMEFKDHVKQMRSKVCDLNEEYFASKEKRTEATLMSLEKLLRKGA